MNETSSRINQEIFASRYNLPPEITSMPVPELLGLLIAHQLLLSSGREPAKLLFDVDGPITNPNSWNDPEVYLVVIKALQKLEEIGVDLGLATARGAHIHRYLWENHQLLFLNDKGLEGGRILVKGDPNHSTVIGSCYEDHQLAEDFVAKLEQHAKKSRYFCKDSDQLPENTFSFSAEQWRRTTQVSMWYRHDPAIVDPDQQPMFLKVQRLALARAKKLGIPSESIDFQINQTDKEGKTYVLISLIPDQTVTKATLLAGCKTPLIFFADGHGDEPLADLINLCPHGFVIAVASDLGESKQEEVQAFRDKALVTLSGPDELAEVLDWVRYYLTR